MDDDPFGPPPPPLPQPRRRRSSMLDKWINDQQARHASPKDTPSPPSSSSSSSNAYLAYPDLKRSSLDTDQNRDSASDCDYDLVNDNDIPNTVLSQLSDMQIPDTPATIRSTRLRSSRTRISLTPSSFRHFGLSFRAHSPADAPFPTPSSRDPSPRPSSRVSLFSRSHRHSTSTGTVTARDSPFFLSRKPSKPSPQITVDPIPPLSPLTSPPPTLRTTSTLASVSASEATLAPPSISTSHGRPSVLGHFSFLHPSSSVPLTDSNPDSRAKDSGVFTSVHTPPSDTNDSPSRPSISSSIDTSHARTHASTSLTVPGAESCTGMDGSSRPPSVSGSPVTPSSAIVDVDADAGRSKKKNVHRYSSPVTRTHLHPHSHSHSHSHSYSHSNSQSPHTNPLSRTSTTSPRSPRSPSHPPVSLTNNPHLADLFLPSREQPSPSPTSTRSTTPSPSFRLSNNDTDLGSASRSSLSPNPSPLPKRYPFVYNNTVQVTARRGANAFNGFYPSYDYWSHDAPNHDGEQDDEVDLDSNLVSAKNRSDSVSVDLGRSVSAGLSRSVSPTSPASQYQRSIGHSSLQQQKKKKKKQDKQPKPEVVYTSNASGGGGGTLRRMTTFSNLNLVGLGLQGGLSKKKKKKLVVGGVPPDDARRFEGVKRWCESFGEVREIKRMPNGDLIVSFQSAEVADTVCCLRAKVFINGVGSVHLSWITRS